MGLFSRETTVYVSSVIYPLGEDLDKIPDLVKAAVITASMKGTSQPRAIDKTIFDGRGVKMTQGYNYAKKYYYAGLPTGFPKTELGKSDTQLMLLVTEYLRNLYPAPLNTVEVKSATVSFGNNYDTRMRQLVETDYKYDFFEEEVYQANNGLAVGALLAYEPLPADELNHPDDVGWKLTFTNPDTSVVVINKWYSEISFLGMESIQPRIVIEYVLNGAPAKTMYYEFGGSDARLNIFLRVLEKPVSGTFPAIVLKKAKTNKKAYYLDEDLFHDAPWADTAAYKTSKKYAQRFDIDIDLIISKLKDNPDQKQIDYAFLQPGTRINSPTAAAAEYHYRYFERLYTSFPSNKAAFDDWVTKYEGKTSTMNKADSCPAQSIHILDPDDTKNSVNMIISWRYISYEVKTGTLTAPYVVECGPQEVLDARYQGGRVLKHVEYDATKLYLRKRLSSTTYGELCVCGLWHENYVYKKNKVQSGIWAAFNDTDGDFGSGFILPLEYEVFVGLSGRERLQLSQEAFWLILNCYKIVKQKWYETDLFKLVLFVVAVVIIVWSWGSLSELVGGIYEGVYAGLYAGGTGVIASATVASAVAAIITAGIVVGAGAAISYVAREAGEYAAEQWGPAWGAVVAVIATLAMTWAMGQGFGALGMNIAPATLPMTVLNVTNAILGGLAVYTNAEMALLQEAQSKWNDYINSPNNPMKEIEQLMAEWFPNDAMKDLIQSEWFTPRESMEDFLARTLGLTDTLTYKLTLPISSLSELTLTPRLA